MSGYISDCIIASDLTPILSTCCWSWDDLTAVEDHTVWRGADVFHQAGAKVVMCYINHAASTVSPSCRNPLKSAPRCVYILVQCLYHLRIPIFWYMALLFQYVGMYILSRLAAYSPSEDLFMDYPEYTGCNRRDGPDFGRVFLMLNYTENPQNTYIQSWTVWEIMASEVWNFDSCYTLTDYQIHIETGRNVWFL